MDFGPDGLLYAPRFERWQIVRVDLDKPHPAPDIIASGLHMPSSVAFDSASNLHGVEFFAGTVFSVEVSTGTVQVLADLDASFDNLAFGPPGVDDRLYVTSFADGQILTMTPRGNFRPPPGPGGANTLAVDGDLLVSQRMVHEFGPSARPAHSRDP